MRAALEDLLRVPDQALEVDRQLHTGVAGAHHLVAQHAQVLLQLWKGMHIQHAFSQARPTVYSTANAHHLRHS
jgi:hypothetical protein